MKRAVLVAALAACSHDSANCHTDCGGFAFDGPPAPDATTPGLTCPAPYVLVADRTSCAATVVEPPMPFATTAAPRGTIVSMDGLDEGALPCVPALVCGFGNGESFVFSDDPETVASDGVLYADTVGPGFVRVYVYHVNGGASARKFPIVLLNEGSAVAHATVLAKGLGTPGTDYVGEGALVAAQFLASAGIEEGVAVPANTRVLLDPALDAAHAGPGELVHAIYDLQLEAPMKLSVVSVDAAADAATTTAGLSLLANDGAHDRGTFPHATFAIETATAAGVGHLRLGDGTTDPELVGRDATTGTAATLHGNYGVTYLVDADRHLALSARGGTWAGASTGTVTLGPLSTTTDAIWLGEPTTPTVLMSGGGSSLPIDMIILPP